MLEAFGLSDAGCVRANNEDYFISDPEAGIFVLADGMGGANAGEFASRLGAERLYGSLRAQPAPAGDGVVVLENAFREANAAVRDTARSHTGMEGMGTTLIVARCSDSWQFKIGSVGDSRAYLLSRGTLTRITQDQTWVVEVGARLGLSQEDLRRHPMRHVLTMAVGTGDELRVSYHSVDLAPGDLLLLSSDGLHGVLAEDFLGEVLNCEKNLPDKCHYLIEAAKAAGGPDNITALLIRVG